MTATPLFVATRDGLLAALRLTNAETALVAGTAQPVIDSAMNKARVLIYKKLGVARVGVIRGYSVEAAPTTSAGIVRMMAGEVEVALVRCELMHRLPVLFSSAAGEAGDIFQGEEAYAKEASRIESECAEAQSFVDSSWGILDGTEELGGASLAEDTEVDVSAWDGTMPSGVRVPGNHVLIGGRLEKPINCRTIS